MDDQMKPVINPEPLSEIPAPQNTKSALPRKPFIIIALVTFAVLISTVSIQIMLDHNTSKSATEKESIPSPSVKMENSPRVTPINQQLITIGGLSIPENVSAKPVLAGQNIYYLKKGDIWKANLDPDGKVQKRIFFEGKGRILDFTISHDQKKLAFLTRKNEYPMMDGAQNGDTVILVNLADKSEKEIFSENLEGRQLNGIEFTPDDKKIYFTNEQIYVYDTSSLTVNKYVGTDKPFSIPCNYDPVEFSPDQKYLLLDFGCWEGSKQVIWDTENNTAVSEFDNGYIGGGIGVYGFLTNDTLLGYDDLVPLLLPSNPASDFDYKKRVQNLVIYSIKGTLIKSLSSYGMPGDNIHQFTDLLTSAEKAYYSLPKKDNIKEYDLFELDRKNQTSKPAKFKNDLVLVDYQESNYKLYILRYSENKTIEIDTADSMRNIKLIP